MPLGIYDRYKKTLLKILTVTRFFIILFIEISFASDDVTRPIDPAAWLQHSEAVRGK